LINQLIFLIAFEGFEAM